MLEQIYKSAIEILKFAIVISQTTIVSEERFIYILLKY